MEPLTESLWLESGAPESRGKRPLGTVRPAEPDPADGPGDGSTPEAPADVAVVGGGLTGLVTAVLLARTGVSVVLIEARHLGAVTTGHSTAKVSLLQGTRLSQLARLHSTSTVQDYVTASREGQQWLLRYCGEHDVPVQMRDAFTFVADADQERKLQQELEACSSAGLDVELLDSHDVPFPLHSTLRLTNQAQVDPMDVVRALARDLRARHGVVRTGTRVTKLQTTRHPTRGRVCVLETEATSGTGVVTAERVVLATGTPILDRGGFFARLEPSRSYAMAFSVPDEVWMPEGMYISADAPTRSLRTAPTAAGLRLLLGGNGHVVGRGGDTRKRVADLYSWARKHFPGAEPTHSWSAQDYKSVDGLPYVGRLLPHDDRVLVATGYDKWGMTSAVAAALALSSTLLEGEMAWAAGWDPWRVGQVKGAAQAAKLNLTVGAELAAGYTVRPSLHGSSRDSSPAEGEGWVERDGLRPTAVCTVDGVTTRRSATCTHLGGVVRWNAAERSWDCPLHGSRFTADGDVLEGPAVHPLSAIRRVVVDEETPGTT